MQFFESLNQVLNTDSAGSKVLRRDDNTAILYNCLDFDHTHVEALIAMHPRITYNVRACEGSSSGFIVVFTNDSNRDIVRSSDFFVIMVSCLIAAAAMSLVM